MTGVAATLVKVDGYGVLLRGAAGSGKSDTALALLDAGHQLIADDAVLLSRQGDRLIGRAPQQARGWLYLRGPGIISVVDGFGEGAVSDEAAIDLVIDLATEPLTATAHGAWQETRIMDITCTRLAISPRRPVAALIMAAVTRLPAARTPREHRSCA